MPDGTSHSPDQTEVIARSVESIVKNAEPTKARAEISAETSREAMKATIAEMKAARSRIGNFVVSFDTPEQPSDTLLFATPIREPYTAEQLKRQSTGHATAKRGYTSSYTLILATPDGFYAHDLHDANPIGLADEQAPQTNERAVENVLGGAAARGDANLNPEEASVWGNTISVKDYYGYNKRVDLNFYPPAEATLVEKALRTSIAKAQEAHQPTISHATQTIESAQAVHDALSGNPTETTPSPAEVSAQPRRGLFSRKR
jgi:hypothetical protein